MFFRRRTDDDKATKDRLIQKLLEAGQEDRPRLLERAVRNGEVRPEDVPEVSRTVQRLESALGVARG